MPSLIFFQELSVVSRFQRCVAPVCRSAGVKMPRLGLFSRSSRHPVLISKPLLKQDLYSPVPSARSTRAAFVDLNKSRSSGAQFEETSSVSHCIVRDRAADRANPKFEPRYRRTGGE